MRIPITIFSSHAGLVSELFAPVQSVAEISRSQVPGNATITLSCWYLAPEPIDSQDAIVLELECGKDVVVAPVATWLYDRLKGRPVTLWIDRTEISIEKEEIRRVLTERIDHEQK